MDYAVVEPGLQAWIAALTGLDPLVVLWQNAPRVRHNGQLALLSWVSVVKAGTDDATWTYDAGAPPLEQMVPEVKGPRLLTLQVAVESYDQRPGHTARALVERLRDRVRAPSSVDALRAMNLGFVQAGSVTTADYPMDQHMVSQAVLEVTLNASAFAVDDLGKTSFIASVGLAAALTDVDGTPLPSSLQPDGALPQ